ncbi:MAG: DUF4337 domain-containing protein [Betaproteobacteria bacterium]|jgi:hypothetical protein|nr:DUF4337 domain-containing protein [Betaproteobacteria bacterium]
MEDEFHVHGAHEHELEHAAQGHGGDHVALAQQVAIFTAILAAVGAVVSYLGGNTQNESLMHKNEAVLYKAHASDQWSFYQAKSTKAHLMSLAAQLAPEEKRAVYAADLARYEQEKKAIKAQAEAWEEKSRQENELAEHAFHPHHALALAMTFIQISIALASVTALTQRRWLLWPAGSSAVVGMALVAWAYW